MIALMYDGLELARFVEDGDKTKLVIHDNINLNWLPYIFLLGYQKDTDMKVVINAWIHDRVFPKNRYNSFLMLLSIGMLKYDANKIAEKTRCSLMTDPYWIAYTEDDTYTKCTARGKVANQYYPYNSLDIENEEDYIWRI